MINIDYYRKEKCVCENDNKLSTDINFGGPHKHLNIQNKNSFDCHLKVFLSFYVYCIILRVKMIDPN